MKKSYIVEDKKIEFRRAKINDNFEEIAELIYKTNPYIYSYWFNNDINEAKNKLKDLIDEPGFIFNFNNLYIAYDKTTSHIIGILCALDKSVDLEFDYTELELVNDSYKDIVNNYIKTIISEVKKYNYMYITNISIDEKYQSMKIGSYLLGYFISQMEKNGFTAFKSEGLLYNLKFKNLFHSFSFKEIAITKSFESKFNEKLENVVMYRKQGDYLPEEFKAPELEKM